VRFEDDENGNAVELCCERKGKTKMENENFHSQADEEREKSNSPKPNSENRQQLNGISLQ
jgi:hypothetical protein